MVHEFGAFRLDVAAGQLFRGRTPIALRPKTWAVLCYLIEHAGALVTKDELLDAVWPGISLNEEAAARHVREVREALGDIGRPTRYVETVHRRGFRFVATVRRLPDRASSPPTAGRYRQRSAAQGPELLSSARVTLGLSSEPMSSSESFVGRREELAAIGAALPRARSGQPMLVGVSGEPGIGKTRLLVEASRIAVAQGFRVLAGCCFEAEGQPPFWPWAQVLRGLAPADARAARRSQPAAASTDLASLVPELAVAPAAAVGEHDTQEARLRLFDAVLATLREVAGEQPLLLVIDDLHWADPASLALLQTAVGDVEGLRLAVLGSYRVDGGRAAATLERIVARLDRRGRFRHVALRGLAEEETGTLLGALAGGTVDAPLIRAVHGRTSGNPYFTAELWRHLLDEGAVRARDGTFAQVAETHTVPEGVRATIGHRLERLSRDCLALLEAASVCGLEFDFDTVRAVAAIDEGTALAAFDEAEGARIISAAGAGPAPAGRHRFVHALARDCLYSGIGSLRRAHLHWAVGEELERRYGDAAASHAAELGHHLACGASRGDAEKAVGYALEAARQATASCGYEAAAAHLERALGVIDGAARGSTSPSARARRRQLLLDLAESHERSGDGAPARARFEEAATLAREDGDPSHLARAALGMATRWTFEDEVVIALLEEALSRIASGDHAMRARLLARLAQALYLLPDTRSRREALCEESLALARRVGDLSLLGEVLADGLEALFHDDNVAERESLAGALYAAASASGNATLQLQAHAWRIVGSMSRGRLHDADAELATFSALARRARQPRFLGIACSFEAALDIARGNLATAEQHARAAARWGERFSAYLASAVAYTQLFAIRREQGRTLDLESDDGSIHIPESGDPSAALFTRGFRWQLPFALAEQGRLDQARVAFDEASRKLDELPPENARNTRLVSIATMSEVAATFGDRRVAERLFALTTPYADQWAVVGFGAHVGVSIQSVRGNLLGTLGAWDESAAHFERAIAEHHRERAVVAGARVLHGYARMLLARARPEDRRYAAALIERGERIAEAAGLVASAEKLARLRTGLAVHPANRAVV